MTNPGDALILVFPPSSVQHKVRTFRPKFLGRTFRMRRRICSSRCPSPLRTCRRDAILSGWTCRCLNAGTDFPGRYLQDPAAGFLSPARFRSPPLTSPGFMSPPSCEGGGTPKPPSGRSWKAPQFAIGSWVLLCFVSVGACTCMTACS